MKFSSLILLRHQQKKQQSIMAKKKLFMIFLMIRLRMTIRERNYLHSHCLLRFVQESAWYKLYRDGGDSDLINVVSVNRNGFERLLSEFRKHFSWKSGTEKGGRPPRCPDKHCALALVLHSYCSEAGQKTDTDQWAIPSRRCPASY